MPIHSYSRSSLRAALLSVPVITLALGTATAQAEDGLGTALKKMVTEGKAAVDLRYRYEGVDQDGIDDDAEASLLRSRLTLTTAEVNGFSAKLEFDDITSVGPNDYNSTENGKTEFPVVADPEGTDLNQAWLQYKADIGTGTLGRQRINHGTQRFVGGVAWRQNEQTFDGLRGVITPLEGLTVDLSYVYNVNRIFGPDDGAQPADWEGDTGLLRAEYAIAEGHKIAGFAYLLDVEDQGGYPSGSTVNNSTETFGLEYTGKFFDQFTVAASYATQSDDGDSELDYEADYYMAELGATVSVVTLKAGYEVLASDNGVGFKTPLATLHKFQGWADKFLATPADGIEDAYFSVSGKAGPVKLAAVYHDFQAESSSTDFGTEVNLVATWPATSYLTLQGKYANFETDDEARYTDTEKFWITAQIKL